MNTENWEKLLQKAIAVLDLAGISTENWTFGGGTALAFWLHHRVSRDIDIFLTDAQLLLLASPRLNSRIADMVSGYEESMASLKVYFPDGEVDFIIAPHLTEDCRRTMNVGEGNVLVETPTEIVLTIGRFAMARASPRVLTVPNDHSGRTKKPPRQRGGLRFGRQQPLLHPFLHHGHGGLF